MRPLTIAACLLFLAAPALAADPAPTAAASTAYLANNARQPGVTVRPSGLQTRILKSGFGKRFSPGAVVQIYYTAKLVNGTVIDGTSPGLPAPIEAGGTLKGLGEGIAAMREGDRWELTLPPSLAFGSKGSGNGAIAPDQALIFDVTVLAVEPATAASAAASNSGFGFTSRNGESRAFWTIHP
jgi:FKBP-type peptidyl-prolyl cis-trans isomerase FklB